MPTFTATFVGSDDGYVRRDPTSGTDVLTYSSGNSFVRTGAVSSTERDAYGGFLVRNVSIPKNAVITSANFGLAFHSRSGTDPTATPVIAVEATDNAAAPTTTTFYSKPFTGAVQYDGVIPSTSPTSGDLFSFNVAAQVQATVNRAGWVSGNSLFLAAYTTSQNPTGVNKSISYHSTEATTPAVRPTLTVTWEAQPLRGNGSILMMGPNMASSAQMVPVPPGIYTPNTLAGLSILRFGTARLSAPVTRANIGASFGFNLTATTRATRSGIYTPNTLAGLTLFRFGTARLGTNAVRATLAATLPMSFMLSAETERVVRTPEARITGSFGLALQALAKVEETNPIARLEANFSFKLDSYTQTLSRKYNTSLSGTLTPTLSASATVGSRLSGSLSASFGLKLASASTLANHAFRSSLVAALQPTLEAQARSEASLGVQNFRVYRQGKWLVLELRANKELLASSGANYFWNYYGNPLGLTLHRLGDDSRRTIQMTELPLETPNRAGDVFRGYYPAKDLPDGQYAVEGYIKALSGRITVISAATGMPMAAEKTQYLNFTLLGGKALDLSDVGASSLTKIYNILSRTDRIEMIGTPQAYGLESLSFILGIEEI